ncbi:MAG: hypothetical protein ABSD88_12360 [Candidatus Korobacteraceae bacterium]|jgi:cytochrome c biogenesis protein CcdA
MWLFILFSMGLLHGIGPDHLAAITAFGAAAGGEFRRVVFFATRFALGHAVVLVVAGVLGQMANLMLPHEWERRFELFGGLLLVATGLVLLAGLISGKIRVHTHHHEHTGSMHHHFHLHLSPAGTHTPAKHPHPHGSTALGLGALFAMGGARSLLTVAPIALARTVTESVLRIGIFCLGIVVSMVIYGWLTQRALQSLAKFADGRHNRYIMLGSGYAVAFFCIFAGVGVLLGKF